MARRPPANWKNRGRAPHDSLVVPKRTRNPIALGKRPRGADAKDRNPYVPTEDWHEPSGEASTTYRIIVQDPGGGYRHVVTPEQIRRRLAELPATLLEPLEVIQLSRMTRKKKSFPCYGMQWGSAIYLYPIETSLVEYFSRPPRPAEHNEARMYGGRWVQQADSQWMLLWTEETIRDFYLNNVLIHELGHLLDDHNSNFRDRERYAEWFAIHYGYRPTRRREAAKKNCRRQ